MLIPSICIGGLLIYFASGSSLTKPPQSALIVGFEKSYEQSLLAYTLSDQSIDATLVVTSLKKNQFYENLRGIEIIKLNISDDTTADKEALAACEALLSDQKILKRVREIQPTFVLFPALRHDACLLPWTAYISSIPVIVTYGPEEDLYAVQRTGVALPMHTGELWSGFWANADAKSVIAYTDRNYVAPAAKVAKQHLPTLEEKSYEELYSKVELIFSATDPILRTNFALLGQQPVDIGCHYCRGAHPLPPILQKELVEFRLGTIAVTLDKSFVSLVSEIARKLPQGRQGQAVAWKNHEVRLEENRPENLFIHSDVDRQDLVGYARARVLLSHCADMELLEAAFHGTPVICFPRNVNEQRNAERAVSLGFSISTNGDTSSDAVFAAIEHVHKTANYREVARGLSVLIRDRPLPPSDRLTYWLDYVARNADRPIKLAGLKANAVRTFAEDSQLLSGLFIGIIVGVALTLVALFAWINVKSGHKQIRKDRKFNQ